MARQSALARKHEARAPRPALKAFKLVMGGAGRSSHCDVTVVYADACVRFEVHREAGANGRCCWYAVAIYGGELHDVRRATRRWEAQAICEAWLPR